MLNRVVLVGRLTKDPDLRYTPSGVAVANFTLAVNRPFSNQQGQRDADFINCVVWRRPAENLANYMKKGSLVGVDGRLQSRSYDDQDGKRVFVTEVVADSVQFLETRGTSSGGQSGPQGSSGFNQNQNQSSQPQANPGNQGNNNNDNPFQDSGEPIDISDDDLPF
ncbi:single-stranded DNA-binding protein [Gracilibacillus sp. YIM 98692]|uniref:single-stranded DNA-binding protein n=1 Tax=Gracilibacillus sp. YIM 98692 TaxID=2663532 RepID=UPI0013D4FC31|nr:single-stranded DNA-binding protein [Gracilibacillus sp. YIM 98692]